MSTTSSERIPRILRSLLAVTGVLLASCSSDPRRVTWKIRFEPAELSTRGVVVETTILRGGCGGDRVYSAEVRPDNSAMSPPRLSAGVYGLSARARDVNCSWFAFGCVEVGLPAALDVLEVTLHGTDEALACVPALCEGGTCGSQGSTDGTWWNAAYSHRIRLSFDNQTGQEDLNGFPLLVVLDPVRFNYALASPSGQDIRFVASDGATVLPHEIERWNGGAKSFVWVRVPRIGRQSAEGSAWLYFGNAAAPMPADSTSVWAEDYDAVYHLSSSVADATVHGYAGTDHSTADALGIVAGARHFDGTAYVDIGKERSFLRNVSGATLYAWTRIQASPTASIYPFATSIHDPGGTSTSRCQLVVEKSRHFAVGARASDAQDARSEVTSESALPTGDWHLVTGVVDYAAGRVQLYLDGALDASNDNASFDATKSADTSSTSSAIGSNDDNSGRFVGDIDEVRVARGAHSGEVVDAHFRSMTDAIVRFTPIETLPR